MTRHETDLVSTGIGGLDEILQGGLVARRSYLVRGGPGAGKTIFGFHFVTAEGGEPALWITMGEPPKQLKANAAALGFDLSSVHFLDLSPGPEFFAQVEAYDIFAPAEVEREPTTQQIVEVVESVNPRRVFIDSMTQFRYLSSDPFQFRKQALSLIRFLVEKGATVVFTSESSPEAPDEDLQFLGDGIIHLGMCENVRTVEVSKLRGSDFTPGRHEMALTERGMVVYPRIVPSGEDFAFTFELLSSGIPQLDQLLHGGIERGSTTLITGPSGVGKTTLGLVFMKEAAGRGERSCLYTFEEEPAKILHRCDHVNIPARAMVEKGTLAIQRVEPLRYSADAFAKRALDEVAANGTRLIMIDSMAGFRLSLRGADLLSRLHALSLALTQRGVTVFLVDEIPEITGGFKATEGGFSYLGDNILFMRYLEVAGHLKRAIGVLKKRLGSFEETLREYAITRYGITVGRPLTELRGILSGVPEIVGRTAQE